MRVCMHRLGAGLVAAACAAPLARASAGDSLWKFYADFSVTVVEPMPDVSGKGGQKLLVGAQDDTLYLVESRGAGAGMQLWTAAFKSTLSAAAALPDLNGDGKADAAAGDELGLIQALNGADGKPLWKFLTFGTVLSLAALPDVNGDGAAELAVGSENDTVYCLSGKPGSALGKSVWEFPVPASKTHGPPVDPVKPLAKAGAGNPFDTRPSGANSVAVLANKGKSPFGLAVGTNNDTVYCLGLSDGAPKWKTELPGDVWKVAAFPDQNGDGVDEVLAACGANAGYLLNGATGAILWSHAVTQGATSVAAAPDLDGDGKADALIGDGNGTLHAVPGDAQGASKSIWMYSFGDASTILSIAVPGDLDKDGRFECVVGTSNDSVALIDGKGNRLWALGLGGQVNAVAAPGDLDGNGVADWVAGSEMGFAQAFSGGGPSAGLRARPSSARRAAGRAHGASPLFLPPGSDRARDGLGRADARGGADR